MNRAQRRGNPVRTRWTAAAGLRFQYADRARSGVELDPGRFADSGTGEARSAKGANERLRAATGRFEAVAKGDPAPLPLTRQQRRYQARMGAKVPGKGGGDVGG